MRIMWKRELLVFVSGGCASGPQDLEDEAEPAPTAGVGTPLCTWIEHATATPEDIDVRKHVRSLLQRRELLIVRLKWAYD